MNELRYLTSQQTDEAGLIHNVLTVPSFVDALHLTGFMNSQEIEIINGVVSYSFPPAEYDRNEDSFQLPEPSRSFTYLDGISYNNSGVPSPVEIMPVSADLLTRIDTSLPESQSLDETHPQYLAEGITTNLIIEDSSDVWVTFITEGANYKNSLGYYTYDLEDGAPEDPSSLEHVLIFPNCSLAGSGGGMNSGMRLYLGRFGAGTVMGWFIVQNGWISGDNVSETRTRLYSDRQYNPENEEYNQHSVLLYDEDSQLFLLAFEDMLRPSGDNDFNDAVFFATANPIENINIDNIPPIDIPLDSDEDGVNDPFDEFPNDPDRAFLLYYPSADDKASLVFEDKWPLYGDYDMNDLVIEYRYTLVTDASNQVKDISADFTLVAAGAGYNNGFSILLPFAFENLTLTGVTGDITGNIIADNDYSILELFTNTTSLTGLPAGTFFNTDEDLAYLEPVDFSADLTLTDPVPFAGLDFSFPFNPFLTRNGDENHEIHLMNFPPTSRMNTSLFQTEDDNSDPAEQQFYVSPLNLPWGLNLPVSWRYPAERNSIVETYVNFASWAESGGELHPDWYTDTPDNFIPSKVYIKP